MTIPTVPLAPLRPHVSNRVWNLLTRAGYTTVAQLRQALNDGLRPGDIRNLGPAALLEVRLALDSLPAGAEQPPEKPSPAPGQGKASTLSERELAIILALAESGMTPDGLQDTCTWGEAQDVLARLREIVRGPRAPWAFTPPEQLTLRAPENWPPRSGRLPARKLTADTEPDGRTVLKDEAGTPLPRSKSHGEEDWDVSRRPEPEPLDDEYEGYVLDAPPGWGT